MSIENLVEASNNLVTGSEVGWNNFTKIIPENVIIFSTDTKKFKRGNGSQRYVNLPDGPTIENIASGQAEVLNILTTLVEGDDDQIIIIDNEAYTVSGTTLSEMVTRISDIIAKDVDQNTDIDIIDAQFILTNTGITVGDNAKLVVVEGSKITPGVDSNELLITVPISPINIYEIGIFNDLECTIPMTEMIEKSSYYVKISAQHDAADIDDLSFELVSSKAYVSITPIGRGIFRVVATFPFDGDATLAATVSDGENSTSDTVTIDESTILINNVIVNTYGGTDSDYFMGVAVDSSDNIICAGYTKSEGAGSNDALVVKFDSNLTILSRKRYGGSGIDVFRNVAVDSSDNIICVGYTGSEGAGGDALVVKFDSNLTILARKRYGGTGIDYFQAVAIDSTNNIICAGYTGSEGAGGPDALVVKFDSNLAILSRKRYGGSGSDAFYGVAIDSNDNIICAGYTGSEGAGSDDALIVKFDHNLTILARKRYGGSGYDRFYGVAVDSDDNIICVGYTGSEGAGSDDALIVKFDHNLTILARKRYGGSGNDIFYGVAVDSDDNIICVGYTGSEGAGNLDALIEKLPSTIPGGTFTGTVLTGLTMADSTLTLADSTLTLADSALTLADSALTLADSALTLADSALTQESDILD